MKGSIYIPLTDNKTSKQINIISDKFSQQPYQIGHNCQYSVATERAKAEKLTCFSWWLMKDLNWHFLAYFPGHYATAALIFKRKV